MQRNCGVIAYDKLVGELNGRSNTISLDTLAKLAQDNDFILYPMEVPMDDIEKLTFPIIVYTEHHFEKWDTMKADPVVLSRDAVYCLGHVPIAKYVMDADDARKIKGSGGMFGGLGGGMSSGASWGLPAGFLSGSQVGGMAAPMNAPQMAAPSWGFGGAAPVTAMTGSMFPYQNMLQPDKMDFLKPQATAGPSFAGPAGAGKNMTLGASGDGLVGGNRQMDFAAGTPGKMGYPTGPAGTEAQKMAWGNKAWQNTLGTMGIGETKPGQFMPSTPKNLNTTPFTGKGGIGALKSVMDESAHGGAGTTKNWFKDFAASGAVPESMSKAYEVGINVPGGYQTPFGIGGKHEAILKQLQDALPGLKDAAAPQQVVIEKAVNDILTPTQEAQAVEILKDPAQPQAVKEETWGIIQQNEQAKATIQQAGGNPEQIAQQKDQGEWGIIPGAQEHAQQQYMNQLSSPAAGAGQPSVKVDAGPKPDGADNKVWGEAQKWMEQQAGSLLGQAAAAVVQMLSKGMMPSTPEFMNLPEIQAWKESIGSMKTKLGALSEAELMDILQAPPGSVIPSENEYYGTAVARLDDAKKQRLEALARQYQKFGRLNSSEHMKEATLLEKEYDDRKQELMAGLAHEKLQLEMDYKKAALAAALKIEEQAAAELMGYTQLSVTEAAMKYGAEEAQIQQIRDLLAQGAAQASMPTTIGAGQ